MVSRVANFDHFVVDDLDVTVFLQVSVSVHHICLGGCVCEREREQ